MTQPKFAIGGEGEIVRDAEQESTIVGRAVDAVKRVVSEAVGDSPRLMLDTHNNTVEVLPSRLQDWRAHQLTTLKDQGLRLMQRLWVEATGRRENAVNVLRIADQRLASLKRLAEQDGLGKEWALLGTPRPPDPAMPEHVRVRVLRPFTRQYHRRISPELREWCRVNELRDAESYYPEIQYDGIALNHVTDIPAEWFDELKSQGLVEKVKPGTAKQLPTGQELP